MSIKKTTQFIFPVGDKELSQDSYYRVLSEANHGFYPFGENGLWHGGMHLDEKVLNKLGNDEQLRCMANGEVIAYRINDVYPKITYPEENIPVVLRGALKNVAYFSTGFTLVRHLLQMPKTTDAKDEPPAITLYSLYMHQLDWYGYQEKMKDKETKAQHPHYWQLASGKVDVNKADTVFGSVIRADGSNTKVVGLLLKGSKIRLGEKHATKAGWYKIVSISEGTLVTSTEFKQQLNDITGYVWHKDVSPIPTGKKADTNQDYEVVKEDNNTVGKSNVKVKGIAVYEAANDKQKLTYLPPKATFELDGEENGYAKIRKIKDCHVPNLLKENDSEDVAHKGYVKVTSLTSFTFKPEKFNDIVILKSPIAISSGDFIGYIGHNQLKKDRFNEPTQASISTIKRPSDKKLPQLLHVELFTCDDLPAFITKTRELADNLPESEKNLILIEKGARLIQASKADGKLNSGLGIKFISDKDSYYVKINLEYTLNSWEYFSENNLKSQTIFNNNPKKIADKQSDEKKEIILNHYHKQQLENRYNKTYPQLTMSDIPDKVELVEVDHNSSSVKIRFCVNTKHYWIASKDVSHLFGQDGTLNTAIPYWKNFPLSLDNLPPATKDNTVHFPRTVSLTSSDDKNLIIDESTDSIWVKVTAGNEERWSITGWVNIKKDAQEHVKRISPWHWQGFETVIEKATVGEFYTKINDNRAGTLDIKEYTDSMKALHKILIESLLYSVQRKKGLPPFTVEFLKDGLRNSWTAEMIGHLIIKYESEWHADEALTKWNEIDSLFEKETQKQKKLIEKWLDDNNITMPYKRNSALNSVDKVHQETESNWQLEKEQRIKPSLWWREVAQSQATQSSNNQTTKQTPAISNLSADGKAWNIHPMKLINQFNGVKILFQKGDKHEIIREINIRLAGFGGNVPTDEFTERTENMIKQFQRDYMQVEETGVVDMKVIEAIDEFQEKYTISTTIWSQIKCKCGKAKCKGFGNGEGKNTSPEKTNPYEYPGIHRSLLFGLNALNFYLSKQDIYKFREISSGYRCSRHSIKTKNHRGKALDIQFNKGDWKIRSQLYKNIKPLKYIRDNFFETYLKTQNRWNDANLFSLEPIGLNPDNTIIDKNHTYSWIHMDVRTFEKKYLLDEYFCTNTTTLNKEKLITLINNFKGN